MAWNNVTCNKVWCSWPPTETRTRQAFMNTLIVDVINTLAALKVSQSHSQEAGSFPSIHRILRNVRESTSRPIWRSLPQPTVTMQRTHSPSSSHHTLGNVRNMRWSSHWSHGIFFNTFPLTDICDYHIRTFACQQPPLSLKMLVKVSSFLEVSLESTQSSSKIGLTLCIWFHTQLPRRHNHKSSGTGPHTCTHTCTLYNVLLFLDHAQHGSVPIANHPLNLITYICRKKTIEPVYHATRCN